MAEPPAVIDHVFICTAGGAPPAERLRQFGLTEGAPNRHPGQGTACRRFFFRNAMLELVWVQDAAEARSEQTRPTRLWERWSDRDACPFGIILRPASTGSRACPFPSWQYRPASMPDLVLEIADGPGLDEPMWCYMDVLRTPADIEHPAGFRELTRVRLTCPPLAGPCVTRAMASAGVIDLHTGPEHVLELEFDRGRHGNRIDFRPELPLCFRW